MASRTTAIEWTQHTWNPFVGCSIKSAGCTNCYAMRQAYRLEHAFDKAAYAGTTKRVKDNIVWTGRVNRASDATMRKPLSLPEGSIIFVNSMSDFWHENAADELRAEALEIIEATPRHIYQVLTKRPENIQAMLRRLGRKRLPSNFWLGTTLEDHRVGERARAIAKVDADVRFLSVEPITARVGPLELDGIHWVITGGESGPKARDLQPVWVREVRDQCLTRSIPFFHKQWGHYGNNPIVAEHGVEKSIARAIDPPANGKGGALLDGRLWREMPVAT